MGADEAKVEVGASGVGETANFEGQSGAEARGTNSTSGDMGSPLVVVYAALTCVCATWRLWLCGTSSSSSNFQRLGGSCISKMSGFLAILLLLSRIQAAGAQERLCSTAAWGYAILALSHGRALGGDFSWGGLEDPCRWRAC